MKSLFVFAILFSSPLLAAPAFSEFTYNFSFDSRAPCRNSELVYASAFARHGATGAKEQFTSSTEFEDSGVDYFRCEGTLSYQAESPVVVSTFVFGDPDEDGVISDQRGIFESYSACYANALNQAHRLHDQGMGWLDYRCDRESHPQGFGRYVLRINAFGDIKVPLQGLTLTAANAHSRLLKEAAEKLLQRRGQKIAIQRNGSYLYYADHSIFNVQTLGFFNDSRLCDRQKTWAAKILAGAGAVDHEILCIANGDPTFRITKLVSVQAEGRKPVRTDFPKIGRYETVKECEAQIPSALEAFEYERGVKPAGALCEDFEWQASNGSASPNFRMRVYQ